MLCSVLYLLQMVVPFVDRVGAFRIRTIDSGFPVRMSFPVVRSSRVGSMDLWILLNAKLLSHMSIINVDVATLFPQLPLPHSIFLLPFP